MGRKIIRGMGARRRWAAVASLVIGLGLAVVPAGGAAAAPVNDDFYGTIIGLGPGVSATGSNIGATVQAGEPKGLNPDALQHTVWFTWDSPSYTHEVTITVNNADFDTEISVFYGGTLDSLVHVASNDDANTRTNESQVTFTANQNTNYRIQVDGWGGAMGSFVLSVGFRGPGNDFPGSSYTAASFSSFQSTTFDGGEAGEPDVFPSDASEWYSWTPPESGLARITTADSSFDTTAAVFSGNTVAQLTPLAWNDDYTTDESLLDVNVTAGQTYRIQVDGKGVGLRGSFALQLALNPPANDLFAMATSLSGRKGSVAGTTVRAMAEPGEPWNARTVWFTYTPTRSGSVAFETGFFPPLHAYTGNSIIGLTEVGTTTSRGTTFPVTAGTAYRISVGEPAYETDFTLRWSDAPCDGRIPTIIGSGSIVGTSGDDVILGSSGADTIDGSSGNDIVCGGGGDDVLAGGAGYDRVLGGGGRDTLRDGPDGDVVLGGPGNDLIIAEPAADVGDSYDGEGGVDTVSYRFRSASVTVTLDDLANDGAAGEYDRVVAESVIGGGAGDTITGNAGPNRLTGLAGNDVLTGGAGPDVVLGGGGDDSLYVQDGVGGNDTADGGPGVDQAIADPGDTVRGV